MKVYYVRFPNLRILHTCFLHLFALHCLTPVSSARSDSTQTTDPVRIRHPTSTTPVRLVRPNHRPKSGMR
jgi:hypothetical protein